jgi:hypothetical protein
VLTLDDPRLNAGYRLPDPVHPDSLVTAIEEVGQRYPMATDDAYLGYVAMELGVMPAELFDVERPLVTGLNDLHTPGAPLRITGKALEHWNLLDALVSQGWTWGVVAKAIRNMHDNDTNYHPPF